MRAWVIALAGCALLASLGCGAYGPPVRASEAASTEASEPTVGPPTPEEERKKEPSP